MKVQYKIVTNSYETPVATCEVPDFTLTEMPDGSKIGRVSEIDAVEETLCDLARNFVTVQWKLPEEDMWFREAEFPEWKDVQELYDRIDELEKKLKGLKFRFNF